MPGAALEGPARIARRPRVAWRSSLVADIDVATGRLLSRDLPCEGFEVEVATTAAAVLSQITDDFPDTIVLGSDLPDMNAFDLIGLLHARSAPPLLMLLTNPAEATVVEAFGAGALDCMTKPFLVAELGARLRRLVRRRLIAQGRPTSIRGGPLDIDVVRWRALVNGVDAGLTAKEHALLRILLEDQGNVVSYRALLARIWGIDESSSKGRIKPLVRNLRRKLALTLDGAVQLLAEPQIGYRLVVAGAAAFPRPEWAG